MPILPKLVESFVDNDTATRGADLRAVRHRLGADAVYLLADPRRAVGPVRPPAGGAAVEFRTGARLRADGAGAVAVLAVRRPGDLRHHVGEHLDRVRLYRRRHAAGTARGACSARSARRSAPASSSVRRSAACSAASIRGCRSGSPRRLSFANALYGLLILPESLPPERRSPFRWKSANPLGALRLLRSNRVLAACRVANFFGQIAHEVLPSTFVLYATYRYGWTRSDRRADAGVGRHLRHGGAGAGVGPIVTRSVNIGRYC